jgi:hypothetical protein
VLGLNREIPIGEQSKMMKWIMVLVLAPVLAATLFLPAATPVQADSPTLTTTLVLPSGIAGPHGELTQTAGYTGTDSSASATFVSSNADTQVTGPFSSAPSLLPVDLASYNWTAASAFAGHPAWATISGAQWVSTTSAHYGVETANEGDTWRLFKTTFNVPSGLTSANIQIAGDNAYEFYLNGTRVATTADFVPSAPVYGPLPGSGSQAPFTNAADFILTPVTGDNTLLFVLRNWNNNGAGNPSGLIYKVTLTSGTISPPTPALYSGHGTWSAAQIVDTNPGPWITIEGASWVSTTSENSGVEIANEGDTWRLFKEDFNIPDDAIDISGTIEIAGDNAYEFYLNGEKVASTAAFVPSAPVYGSWSGSGSQVPFTSIASYSISPKKGNNTLMFVLRNWNNNGAANPSGLIYKVTVQYDMPLLLPAKVWYLNSIDHTTIGSPKLEMEKIEGYQHGQSSSGKQWVVDQDAGGAVTFPAGVWDFVLNTDADWRSACEITLNEVDGLGNPVGSAFSGTITSHLISQSGSNYLLGFEINAASVTIAPGHYLALTINTTDGQSHTIYTDGSSYLSPPEGSPDYPLPEMSAGMLLGLGLIGLIGFVLIRRRRVGAANRA